MKKLNNVKRVLLLTIILIIGMANKCFAMYMKPTLTERFIWSYGNLILIIEIILGILFIASLVGMIIAKIKNLDKLLLKSKKMCENLFYYSINVIGIFFAIIMFLEMKPYECFKPDFWEYFSFWDNLVMLLIGILPSIFMALSLFFRLKSKSKNKKISYIILGIYIILIIFIKLFG